MNITANELTLAACQSANAAVPEFSLFPVQGAPSLAAVLEAALAVKLTLITWFTLGSDLIFFCYYKYIKR